MDSDEVSFHVILIHCQSSASDVLMFLAVAAGQYPCDSPLSYKPCSRPFEWLLTAISRTDI